MATFTIDLLTGNVYLFNKNFGSSTGGTSSSGATYPQVVNYAALPPAALNNGKIYLVLNPSGTYILNRKDAGLYWSNGFNWVILGNVPPYFSNTNFQIYDGVDNTKGVSIVTSGLTSGIFRKLKVQNSDGTIAYLTDLNTKVNTSVFNTYTGTTAPATYLSISNFNNYSGDTFSLIQGKQDTLIAGTGISIVGNTISATGSVSTNTALQLLDISGGTNVNTIAATPIIWTTQVFTGTSLIFTGGSRIYIQESGVYEISYVLNIISSSIKNIGSVIRKNGNVDITPLSTSSFIFDFANNSSGNTMPQYLVSLLNGDYIELVGFRIGTNGVANTKANGTWIKIKKN
jgi:hypothetical protein